MIEGWKTLGSDFLTSKELSIMDFFYKEHYRFVLQKTKRESAPAFKFWICLYWHIHWKNHAASKYLAMHLTQQFCLSFYLLKRLLFCINWNIQRNVIVLKGLFRQWFQTWQRCWNMCIKSEDICFKDDQSHWSSVIVYSFYRKRTVLHCSTLLRPIFCNWPAY